MPPISSADLPVDLTPSELLALVRRLARPSAADERPVAEMNDLLDALLGPATTSEAAAAWAQHVALKQRLVALIDGLAGVRFVPGDS